jgi:hypothetical protein
MIGHKMNNKHLRKLKPMIPMKAISTALLLFALTSLTSDELPKSFSELLVRAHMTFQYPEGLEETKIIENKQMNYEYALKYPKKKFEVRYAIRPLDKLMHDYRKKEKKKGSGDININPNEWYSSMLQATILNISGGQLPEITNFNKQAVKKEFNADWGATCFFEVGKEFGQSYKYCMVVAIHKDNCADAYYFYLSNSKDDFSELMSPAFHSLKFK